MNDHRATVAKGSYSAGDHYRESMNEKVKEHASDAVDQGAEYAQQAQDIAVEKLGEIETAIRRNPLQAAAIAAGVGFVFALIARR